MQTDALEVREHKLLVAEPDEHWATFMNRELAAAGVGYLLVPNLAIAIRQVAEDEFSGVITDDLRGQWGELLKAAHMLELPTVLFSANKVQLRVAEVKGVPRFDKGNKPKSQLAGILRLLVPGVVYDVNHAMAEDADA